MVGHLLKMIYRENGVPTQATAGIISQRPLAPFLATLYVLGSTWRRLPFHRGVALSFPTQESAGIPYEVQRFGLTVF